MKFTWRTELPALAIIAAMWSLAAFWWNTTPQQVPVHWGLDGRPDAWGGRAEGLLLLPAVATGIFAIFRLAPLLDPGRANYEQFTGVILTLRLSVLAFMAAIYCAMLGTFRGAEIDMTHFIVPLAGAMLIVIGNLMGKMRPNWFMGVRTPWTLSSKLSWSRTHRAAGWVFITGGVLLAIAGLSSRSWPLVVALGFMGAGVLSLIVYSYIVWKGDPDKVPPAGTAPATEG